MSTAAASESIRRRWCRRPARGGAGSCAWRAACAERARGVLGGGIDRDVDARRRPALAGCAVMRTASDRDVAYGAAPRHGWRAAPGPRLGRRQRRDEDRDDGVDARVGRDRLDRRGGSPRSWRRRACRRGCRWRRPGADAPAAPGGSSSASGSIRRPAAAQASAQAIAGPPALVTIATRSPRGRGWCASSAATSSCSSRVSTRMTPAWSKRASTVASEACEQSAGMRRRGALPRRQCARS